MDYHALADWSCFDRAYCISLVDRPDRRAAAERQFAAVGLKHVEFYLATRHPRDATEGIYESHLTCLRQAIEAGARRILIFEDDVVFARLRPEIFRHMADFIGGRPDFGILFLGCMVQKSWPVAPSIRGIRYRALTHAYAISGDFAATIVRDHPWHGQPYDDFLRDLPQTGFYTLYPAIAFQSDASSDNKPYLPLDRLRRALGGLMRLQKMNEFFHCHRRVIVVAHIFALFLAALWWWR